MPHSCAGFRRSPVRGTGMGNRARRARPHYVVTSTKRRPVQVPRRLRGTPPARARARGTPSRRLGERGLAGGARTMVARPNGGWGCLSRGPSLSPPRPQVSSAAPFLRNVLASGRSVLPAEKPGSLRRRRAPRQIVEETLSRRGGRRAAGGDVLPAAVGRAPIVRAPPSSPLAHRRPGG